MNPNQTPNPRLMDGTSIAKEIVAIVADENKITLSQLSRAKILYDELYYREAMQSRIPTRFEGAIAMSASRLF